MDASTQAVEQYLTGLQDRICAALEAVDGAARFVEDDWERPEGGGGRSRVMAEGRSSSRRGSPSPMSTVRRSGLGHRQPAGPRRVRLHRPRGLDRPPPAEPLRPTTHLNVRYFVAEKHGSRRPGGSGRVRPHPVLPFEEDVVHWHTVAHDLCQPFGEDVYPRFKRWCDKYFYLRHRGEPRGVGASSSTTSPSGGSSAASPSSARWATASSAPICRSSSAARVLRTASASAIFNSTAAAATSSSTSSTTRHPLRPAVRWAHGVDPHVPPAAGPFPLQLAAGAGEPEARLYEVFLHPREWIPAVDASLPK